MGGKYMIGQPISWLKFWVFICKAGQDVDDKVWTAVEGDAAYSDVLTDQYNTKMANLVKNALALE